MFQYSRYSSSDMEKTLAISSRSSSEMSKISPGMSWISSHMGWCSVDYLVIIGSIQLGQGALETVPQLALHSNVIHAMMLCCLETVTGIVSPHQVNQKLDLLGVQGHVGDHRGARIGHRGQRGVTGAPGCLRRTRGRWGASVLGSAWHYRV